MSLPPFGGHPSRREKAPGVTDGKSSIKARRRIHATVPTAPGWSMRVEHGYERKGAWAYLAAWDVRRARIHGRCEHKTGIAPFERLVEQVMGQEPYRSGHRVFWIMDNGSSYRGQRCVTRLTKRWPTIVAVHTPVHASWLNQVEVYFPIIQRKVLTPNDFATLAELKERLLQFQTYYEAAAKPFQWKFTRRDPCQAAIEVESLGRLAGKGRLTPLNTSPNLWARVLRERVT